MIANGLLLLTQYVAIKIIGKFIGNCNVFDHESLSVPVILFELKLYTE